MTKAQEALAQKEAYAQQVQEDVLEYNRCLVSREEYLTERQENLMKKIQSKIFSLIIPFLTCD